MHESVDVEMYVGMDVYVLYRERERERERERDDVRHVSSKCT